MSFAIIAVIGLLFGVIVWPIATGAWFAFWMTLAFMDVWTKLDKHLTSLRMSNQWLKLYHQKMLMETHPEKAQAILQSIHKVLEPNWQPPEPEPEAKPAPAPTPPPKPERKGPVFQTEIIPEYPEEKPAATFRPKKPNQGTDVPRSP